MEADSVSEIRATLVVKGNTKAIASRRFAVIQALLHEVPGVRLAATDGKAGAKSSTAHAALVLQPFMRVTVQLRQVVQALLEIERTDGPNGMYALKVVELTGVRSGTVTPILHRLVGAGWVTVAVEEQPAAPSRRLHHFTEDGRQSAARLLNKSE